MLVHRVARPLRGSVSCGSGWSVPCVSIQLTLSQKWKEGRKDRFGWEEGRKEKAGIRSTNKKQRIRMVHVASSGFSTGFSGDTMGEKFRTYFAIETAWWVGVYAICYRFQPTIAIMRTGAGRAAVHRAGEWLQRMWPSRYESIAKASERGFASPNGRTFGEWVLINKVLAPFSFPLKLAAANRIVNQKRAAVAAWTLSGGSLALTEGSGSGSSSSDLVQGTGNPLQVAGP